MKVERWSPSFIKKYKACKFAAFCKITRKPREPSKHPPWGDAGSIVHHVLEYYYYHKMKTGNKLEFKELEQRFDQEWYEGYQITSPKLNRNLYWLCVVNGVQLNLEVTGLEKEYNLTEPFIGIGYADIENDIANWIGDWKTATYKASKLVDFKEQLRFYALAKWRKTGTIPMTWVYFNKVNKIFKYKWTEESLIALEQEIVAMDKEVAERFKTLDFPRSSSRGNCFFCDYQELCATDLLREEKSPVYSIIFSLKKQKLLIEGSIPDIIHRRLEKEINYLVKNAHFIIKAMKMRGVNYDGIKRIYKRKVYGAETTIGYMHACHRVLKEYAHSQGMKLDLTLKDYRNQEVLNNKIETSTRLNTNFDLYDFQNQAVKELIKFRWGICEIGTGGGKTAIAAECIRQLKYKTLFVIDNKDLLMQTKDEYEQMLGVECGVVGMGQREWDKPITLATIQTLAKHAKSFAGELSKFPLVLFDETHIIASKSFVTLSKYLTNTKYRFGFSATAKRDDGDDNLIYANTGQVVFRLNAKDLIAKNVLVPPICTFYKYKSKNLLAENWQNEYEAGLVENELRNDMIVTKALELEKAGKQFMILCTRIKHCEALLEKLPGAKLVYGKTKDDIRYEVLNDFKAGKFKILIGNLKIFNKGLNIKCLDGVINAAGNAGNVLTVQTIGRPLRKSPGKKAAFYIDFIDNGDYLYAHSMARVDALRNESYNVEIVEWKNI